MMRTGHEDGWHRLGCSVAVCEDPRRGHGGSKLALTRVDRNSVKRSVRMLCRSRTHGTCREEWRFLAVGSGSLEGASRPGDAGGPVVGMYFKPHGW